MFLDFEYQLRTNPAFYNKIEKAIKRIISTSKEMHKSNRHKADYLDALKSYLEISNFNISPLLGYYYPNYPDGPYSLKDFPFAHAYYTLNLGENSYCVYRGSRQIGKCLTTNNLCKIRNKKTGEVMKMPIGKVFELAKKSKKITMPNNIDKKFIESYDLSDFQVETDTGFVDIKAIHKTIPYIIWEIETESGKTLSAADTHILFDEYYNEIFIKDLIVNQTKIQTEDGIELVTSVKKRDDLSAESMYDLELDTNDPNANYRYYTNNILSHNTTNFGIRTNTFMRLLPGIKIAGIVPRSEQLKTIADKYKEVENAFRFNFTNSKARSNLFFKEFPSPTGKMSQLRLWYILTSADKIRGNTYDWIDFDEYQDFDNTLETEILATQSRTKIPMVTYAGTSKSVDTSLEERWLQSARGVWRMTCPACHYDNIPTLEYGVMDMIQPKGLCCKKCGKLLNVRDGKWDFAAPNLLELGKWGFHIPQIIVPANTENKSKWMRIYVKSQDKKDFKGFCEEYLGEATEEGSKELSVNDLQKICKLGPMSNLRSKALDAKYGKHYQLLLSGVDWGGSDYNPASKTKASYTVHTIIGVLPSGEFDIIEVNRYAGMDWDEIAQSIAHTHNKYHCFALGCDRGVGEVYINALRKLMNPLKVITFKYAVPKSAMLAIPKESQFLNMYSLNRTESISALFSEIKNERIRTGSWEEMKDNLLECLNLVRSPSESSSGETSLLYLKKPNKTDDFLHSLNFACILAKVIRGEPLFEDEQQRAIFMSRLLNKPLNRLSRPASFKSISI